jgi:long-subunit fatty acid transport protein
VVPLLLTLLFGTRGLLAQDLPQPLFQAPFTFPNPGARSLGFGGAFVALADDATAAIANPAGLVQLLEPEVSIDVRLWDYSTDYTSGGRIRGAPTGTGLDDTAGLRFGESSETLAGLSFLSYVYPKKKWSFAFHRHLQADFESTSETQGLFTETTTGPRRISDQRATADFELLTYGVSAAYKLSDRFSIGAGLVYFEGLLTLGAATFARDDDSPQSLYEPISYLPQRLKIDQVLSLDESDWGFNLGILWKLSSAWSAGAVYRKGATFDNFRGYAETGPANGFGLPPGIVMLDASLGDLAFPDGYGAGIAYRSPAGRFTTSFEWDRVEYADVARSLDLTDQEIDDSSQLRLGGEYVILDSTPVVALRAGAWYEPDNLMRGNGSKPIVDALVPAGDDEMHYSSGLGVAFETFQLDIGIDLSQSSDTLSVSAVFSI